jgi:predicted porin
MKNIVPAALLAALFAPPVCAENSVTIYGLIDAGMSYVSNQNGRSVNKFDDGIYAPSLLGFRGHEDLGGGTQALFLLENQIALGSGGVIPSANLFWNRQAYVGLSSPALGRLTLGTQFDFMWDDLAPSLNDPAVLAGGLYNFSGGPFSKLGVPKNPTGGLDWDRAAGSARASSAVKYQSPSLGGFVFGALYGFGTAGGDRTVSAGGRYEQGPGGIGAAYTSVNYFAGTPDEVAIRNWGLGGHYIFGPVIGSAMVSSARNAQSGAKVNQVRLGAKWNFSGPWSLGGAYTYMKGNRQLDNNHAQQIGATLSYAFSKRTLVYLQGVHQRTNAGAQAHIMGIMDPFGASSTSKQSILRIGMQTSF